MDLDKGSDGQCSPENLGLILNNPYEKESNPGGLHFCLGECQAAKNQKIAIHAQKVRESAIKGRQFHTHGVEMASTFNQQSPRELEKGPSGSKIL